MKKENLKYEDLTGEKIYNIIKKYKKDIDKANSRDYFYTLTQIQHYH